MANQTDSLTGVRTQAFLVSIVPKRGFRDDEALEMEPIGQLGTPVSKNDKIPVFTPDSNPLPIEEEESDDVSDTTEKTSQWAALCFSAALTFMGLSSYYCYRAVKERSFSLLVHCAFWSIVATVIGTAGEILQKTTAAEALSLPNMGSDPEANPYQKGQPIPIDNTGNTCFVNAPIQAIMNDAAYRRIFKTICELSKSRHETFKKFLELYPKKLKGNEIAKPLVLDDDTMRHVLAMLSWKKSGLKYDSADFQKKYPKVYEALGKFSEAQKEEEFARIVYNIDQLNQEFGEMKKNGNIFQFFSEQHGVITKEIRGFEAFLTLIDRYEKAENEEPHQVSFLSYGGWISSSIGNVRNLMQGAGAGSQEDVSEFLSCLSKYVLPADYPEIFFSVIHQQLWELCPEQDEEKIRRNWERHLAGDTLTKLPADLNTSKPAPCCILKIEDPLTEQALGQILINDTLSPRNPLNDATKSAMVFLVPDPDNPVQHVPKMYYPVRERFVIQGTPERIIIQLKRFESTDDGRREKQDCAVNMPEEITIQDQQYQLKSIVVHSGNTTERGHYYAFVKKECEVKKDEKWWYASDDFVREALPAHKEIALKGGYLYFYERKIVEEPTPRYDLDI